MNDLRPDLESGLRQLQLDVALAEPLLAYLALPWAWWFAERGQHPALDTLPKVTTAVIPQGSHLIWDVSATKFDVGTATPATGDVSGPPAVAFEAAGNGATTLAVKLTGVPGTVT